MSVLGIALDPATVIVAVDSGKAFHRVWISDGSGSLVDPMSLPVSRDGISRLEVELGRRGAGEPVIAVEASGSLHRPWAAELERHHPGAVRDACLLSCAAGDAARGSRGPPGVDGVRGANVGRLVPGKSGVT